MKIYDLQFNSTEVLKLMFISFFYTQPRFRIRENTQRFRLDTQESQWSSRFNQNSFQPIDEEKSKAFNNPEVDDNQEIVTANPNAENVSLSSYKNFILF